MYSNEYLKFENEKFKSIYLKISVISIICIVVYIILIIIFNDKWFNEDENKNAKNNKMISFFIFIFLLFIFFNSIIIPISSNGLGFKGRRIARKNFNDIIQKIFRTK